MTNENEVRELARQNGLRLLNEGWPVRGGSAGFHRDAKDGRNNGGAHQSGRLEAVFGKQGMEGIETASDNEFPARGKSPQLGTDTKGILGAIHRNGFVR